MSVTRIFDLLKRYRELYPQKPDALAAKVNGAGEGEYRLLP